MAGGALRSRDGSHSAVIVALLVVTLLTAALLAWQGHETAVSHRVTAESVLRDYARLAADEVVRRGAVAVDYYGYYPLMGALRRRVEAGAAVSDALPAALATDADERVREAAPLVRGILGWDGRRFAGTNLHPDLSDTLGSLVRHRAEVAGPPSSARFVLHVVHGAEARAFVFAPLGGGRLLGFEADLREIGKRMAGALEGEPLLPPSLGGGRVGNDALFVRVEDPVGVERYRAGQSTSGALPARAPFGDAYGGVLEGFTAEVAIDPKAAPELVIGGLPPSRLPIRLGLLGVTAGLLVAAVVLLRRERELARLRSEFVSGVSHELRTPLTQIRMFAETLLLGRVRSDEERTRALLVIDREARRLSHLVENVLQFSRAEKGALTVALEERELGPIVREVLDGIAPLAEGAGARLEEHLQADLRAPVDADALRQVLLNLLDNALKYGPRDHRIAVSLEKNGDRARLCVEDEGPGIPPGDRERVFDRYRRLERDRRSSVAGAGIGLAVVRELAARHGGRAFVEDGARGGARFVVELPGAFEGGPA